jgi:hypothetical protein
MMATMGLPTTETATAHGEASAPLEPAQPGAQSDAMVVTPQQRGYLEALRAAGVEPSSDLAALSIGSYVCQARAAKQTDQAVWDFVLPLVRSDVRDGRLSSIAPATADVHSATVDYIRIATDRLC